MPGQKQVRGRLQSVQSPTPFDILLEMEAVI